MKVALGLYETEDADILAEAEGQVAQSWQTWTPTEMKLLLSGTHDANNAILEIHPGAGGTESQD